MLLTSDQTSKASSKSFPRRAAISKSIEDTSVENVPQTSGADVPSEDETADARSEGAMDLRPVLKVLEARSIVSTNIGAASSEVSTIGIGRVRATPKATAEDNILAAPSYKSAARSNAPPVGSTEDADKRSTSNMKAKPVEKEVLDRTATKSRTIVLKNLPNDSDYTLMQSLVYGVAITSMKLNQEKNTARVKVTSAEGCQKYVDSCSGSIMVQHNRAIQTVVVQVSEESETFEEKLQAYLDCGATRVVKVEDADERITIKALYRFAEGAPTSREVESVVDSCRRGIRNIVFRFTGIHDAVAFRSDLLRDRGWKSKNPHFSEDPCETATCPRSE